MIPAISDLELLSLFIGGTKNGGGGVGWRGVVWGGVVGWEFTVASFVR